MEAIACRHRLSPHFLLPYVCLNSLHRPGDSDLSLRGGMGEDHPATLILMMRQGKVPSSKSWAPRTLPWRFPWTVRSMTASTIPTGASCWVPTPLLTSSTPSQNTSSLRVLLQLLPLDEEPNQCCCECYLQVCT